MSKLCEKFKPQLPVNGEQLHIYINIDGIPLFNSNSTLLWPILGHVKELPKAGPFPIAVFCSASKPTSVDDYLSDFVFEMKHFELHCFEYENNKYTVVLHALICDAPARAFVKCIKTHNGYNCCERCSQRGEWDHKILLPNLSSPRRTDQSFADQSDSAHHVGVSPLSQLSLGMVSAFPLDYMHLVCLGVVRRLLNLWCHGSHDTRLSQAQLATISDKLATVRPYIPREFSGKPRALAEYKQWKATELRMFLLYTGPVVLKSVLSLEKYSNFLNLSVAMRILLSPSLYNHYLLYTEQLLCYFVSTFGLLYGRNQLVYNVHSLIHLPDDARQFGALDDVSSFKFESYLGRLKKLVRRPQFPVAQIVRRVMEGHGPTDNNDLATSSDVELGIRRFKQQHLEGPLPVTHLNCLQYKQYIDPNSFILISQSDNCCQIKGKVGVVRNILLPQAENPCSDLGYVVFEEFERCEMFFSDPLDSTFLSVFFVSNLGCIRSVYPIN